MATVWVITDENRVVRLNSVNSFVSIKFWCYEGPGEKWRLPPVPGVKLTEKAKQKTDAGKRLIESGKILLA